MNPAAEAETSAACASETAGELFAAVFPVLDALDELCVEDEVEAPHPATASAASTGTTTTETRGMFFTNFACIGMTGRAGAPTALL